MSGQCTRLEGNGRIAVLQESLLLLDSGLPSCDVRGQARSLGPSDGIVRKVGCCLLTIRPWESSEFRFHS